MIGKRLIARGNGGWVVRLLPVIGLGTFPAAVCGQYMLSGLSTSVMNPPSSRLMGSFGQLGGSLGAASGSQYQMMPGNVATVSRAYSQSVVNWSPGRRYQFNPSGPVTTPWANFVVGRAGGSSVARHINEVVAYRGWPGFFLRRIDSVTFTGADPIGMGNQNLEKRFGRFQTRYASWVPAEYVARRSEMKSDILLPTEQTGQPQALPPPRLTMQEIMRNDLSGRQTIYEAEVMEAFKAGRYLEACERVSMADLASQDDPPKQVYGKLLTVYANIAAKQYHKALHALYWIVSQAPSGGYLGNAEVFNRCRDVRSYYGKSEDYVAHNEALELYVSETHADREAVALLAMEAWGKNDVNNALFYAGQLTRIAGAQSPWARLANILQLADQSDRTKGRDGGRLPAAAVEPPAKTGKTTGKDPLKSR